ncbi:MAG: LysM peptidoglycan-binding domain-containing protein [Candidatus Saccharibacteria bacterium]|nr:LysM peptidoglycan-binding domain-containing protein [Candidatus Saccharibacteria bacterium]
MIISNPVPLRDAKRHAGSKFKQFRSNKVVSISSYVLIFGLIVGLAYTGRDSDSLVLAEQDKTSQTSVTSNKPSIDQVAATDLAANLATQAEMPIANNVTNQAISLNAKSQLAQTNDETISKPQIIASNVSASKSFTTYRTQTGDTTPSVAAKFGLNPNTIKWANGIAGDAIEPGRDLLIPPVDGIVYSAQAGDTVEGIAAKFSGSPERVVLYNDLEASAAIPAGTQIIIPGGSPAAVVASVSSGRGSTAGSAGASTSASLSGGNRYDYGYCTWYAYNRRAALGMPIGGMWGNASSWASLARGSGFLVNNRASVGAVLQTPNAAGGYGHVAVVESVNSDGSILISEMNFAGWNVKSTRTIPASSVGSYNYIH